MHGNGVLFHSRENLLLLQMRPQSFQLCLVMRSFLALATSNLYSAEIAFIQLCNIQRRPQMFNYVLSPAVFSYESLENLFQLKRNHIF